MAVINERYRYVFLAERYTASQAMRDALLQHGWSRVSSVHQATMDELIATGLIRNRSYLTSFCVIRNPADILVSDYLNSDEQRKIPFSEYIRNHAKDNLFLHAGTVDLVLRYEKLAGGLNNFFWHNRIPLVTLPVVGKTDDKKPWPLYYDIPDLEYMITHYSAVPRWGYIDAIQQQIDVKMKNWLGST